MNGHHPSFFRVHRYFADTEPIDELIAARVPKSTILALYPFDLIEYAVTLQQMSYGTAMFDELYDVLDRGQVAVASTIWAFLNHKLPVNEDIATFSAYCSPLKELLKERAARTGRTYDELTITRTLLLTMYSLAYWNSIPVLRSVPKRQHGALITYLSDLATFCERSGDRW